jgi:MFS family permease
MKPAAMLRVSVPILLAGLTMLVVGMWFAFLAVFVVGGIVTGAGAGLVFRGAMVRAGEAAPAQSRAEVMAGFFLASYLGLSLPVIGLGVALSFAAAREVMLAFVIVVALAIVLSVRSATREPLDRAGVRRQLVPTEN